MSTTGMYKYAVILVLLVSRVVCAGNKYPLPRAIDRELAKAGQLELLSLRPGSQSTKSAETFHGWEILGRSPVADESVKAGVLAAIRRGIAESDGSMHLCFEPRHGLRFTSGKLVVDLVICFECRQIQSYLNGREKPTASTSTSSEELLDQLLVDAKVQLADKAAR